MIPWFLLSLIRLMIVNVHWFQLPFFICNLEVIIFQFIKAQRHVCIVTTCEIVTSANYSYIIGLSVNVRQFGCGILKMVGPKIQDFCPRINMLKGNCFKQSCYELWSVKKCRNCTFKVNFLCQKSTDFFKKKII